HALAKLRVAKVRDGFDQRRVGVWRGDQFQQTHIARRIEKVRAEPRAPEVGGKSLGDFCHRKPAGVGGNDGAGLADRFYFLQQRAFDVEVLDDGLDNPVDLGQALQVVFEISNGDELRKRRFEKRGGLRFSGSIESGGCDFVARRAGGVWGHYVEQQGRDSRVGE